MAYVVLAVAAVLRREQHYSYSLEKKPAAPFRNPHRPWSVTNATYSIDAALPYCATPRAAIDAVRLGHRAYAAGKNVTDFLAATYKSAFVPAGCNLRFFVHPCVLMAYFLHVVFVGDSLTRHVILGMMALVRRDMRHVNGLTGSCQCDG
jgi:hypothetical protein